METPDKRTSEAPKSKKRHPSKVAPPSRQVRRQFEKLAKKASLVAPKKLGREL